jgi:UPF0042 nucleotide-binding protein
LIDKLIIISGLSGSGKSVAMNALEDVGYYVIDNLPIVLFDQMSELFLEGSQEIQKLALAMDLRDQSFIEHYPEVFKTLKKQFERSEILFLEASDEALMRRFSETRRKHPLNEADVAAGIKKEKQLLSELKGLATTVVDTSNMDVHDLKKRIQKQFATPETSRMSISIKSFGFKHGVPKNCDIVLDCRFLLNPHFEPSLREHTGLDQEVRDYISKDGRAEDFISKTLSYLEYLIPQYASEGKSYLTVGIGCTGGKHRSVFVASELAERLKKRLEGHHPVGLSHSHIKE